MTTLIAKGQNGQLHFDGQYVTIRREGFLARTTIGRGEKRLHVSQITGIQWKSATAFVRGFIQFTIPGGVERRSRGGNQIRDAFNDENSLVFTKAALSDFARVRDAIDAAIARQHAPAAAPAPTVSVANELAKLATLLERGHITAAEFDAQKRRLLG
jgi:hypothetical protein